MTAQWVYDQVCFMLLEDTGLQLVYSVEEFLSDLKSAIGEMLQETSVIWGKSTYDGQYGEKEYVLGNQVMSVREVLFDRSSLQQDSSLYIGFSDNDWNNELGEPRYWRQDNLDPALIHITPAPDRDAELLVYSSTGELLDEYTLDDEIDIPKSMAGYLKFFVLKRIWKTHGEARDTNRASYADARCRELINICRAILHEDMAEEPIKQ